MFTVYGIEQYATYFVLEVRQYVIKIELRHKAVTELSIYPCFRKNWELFVVSPSDDAYYRWLFVIATAVLYNWFLVVAR